MKTCDSDLQSHLLAFRAKISLKIMPKMTFNIYRMTNYDMSATPVKKWRILLKKLRYLNALADDIQIRRKMSEFSLTALLTPSPYHTTLTAQNIINMSQFHNLSTRL